MGRRVPAEPREICEAHQLLYLERVQGPRRRRENDLPSLRSVNRLLRVVKLEFNSNWNTRMGTCSDGSGEGCKYFGSHMAPLTRTHTHTCTRTRTHAHTHTHTQPQG